MNARWVEGRAEDLPAGLGTFGVVTFAASFHWMDQPPVERIAELRRVPLGQERRAGRGIRNSSPGDEAAVFRAAGFAGPELVVVSDGRTIVRSADDLVAETFSLSSTAPHLFGDRQSHFEADLRGVLAEASRDGAFAVRLPDNELKIWRVAAHGQSGAIV